MTVFSRNRLSFLKRQRCIREYDEKFPRITLTPAEEPQNRIPLQDRINIINFGAVRQEEDLYIRNPATVARDQHRQERRRERIEEQRGRALRREERLSRKVGAGRGLLNMR